MEHVRTYTPVPASPRQTPAPSSPLASRPTSPRPSADLTSADKLIDLYDCLMLLRADRRREEGV